MRWIAVALCTMTLASTGCTVCRWTTDCCGDVIDDISDHECELDCLYHPSLDVSRIGKPDWCQCPINSCLDCRQCACNRPDCGPRNRWRDLQACLSYEYPREEQLLPTPVEFDETLPPSPITIDPSIESGKSR